MEAFFLYIFNRGLVLFCAAFSVCVFMKLSLFFLRQRMDDPSYHFCVLCL